MGQCTSCQGRDVFVIANSAEKEFHVQQHIDIEWLARQFLKCFVRVQWPQRFLCKNDCSICVCFSPGSKYGALGNLTCSDLSPMDGATLFAFWRVKRTVSWSASGEMLLVSVLPMDETWSQYKWSFSRSCMRWRYRNPAQRQVGIGVECIAIKFVSQQKKNHML